MTSSPSQIRYKAKKAEIMSLFFLQHRYELTRRAIRADTGPKSVTSRLAGPDVLRRQLLNSPGHPPYGANSGKRPDRRRAGSETAAVERERGRPQHLCSEDEAHLEKAAFHSYIEHPGVTRFFLVGKIPVPALYKAPPPAIHGYAVLERGFGLHPHGIVQKSA